MKPGSKEVPTAWRGLEQWLVDNLNVRYREASRTVVEIGVDWGYSLWWLQSIFPFAKIYGVDPYGDTAESWAGPQGSNALEHVKGWVKNAPRVKLITLPSVEAAEQWTGPKIDFVHLDGRHDYDSVSQDFHAWLPHLKHQCCIAFHDVISHYKTVGRLCLELEKQRELGRFIYRTSNFYGFWVWQQGV